MSDLLLYGVVFFVISFPVVLLARRRGRNAVGRRFLIAAVTASLFASAVATTSDVLVQECLDVGNTRCFDGSPGILFFAIGAYALVAFVAAWVIYKD